MLGENRKVALMVYYGSVIDGKRLCTTAMEKPVQVIVSLIATLYDSIAPCQMRWRERFTGKKG